MFEIHNRFNHFQASTGSSGSCQSPLSFPVEVIIIVACCFAGIIWAIVNILLVERIDVLRGFTGYGDREGQDIDIKQKNLLLLIGRKISSVIQI